VLNESPEARWLLLIHQIPPTPNYLRVKIGRRLQKLGSVPIKNSVYVLPRGEQAREDFEWVVREIAEAGGDASVCEARFVEGLSDGEVEALFSAAREADYRELSEEARGLQSLLSRGKGWQSRVEEIEAGVARLRKRLAELSGIDFFAANGREAVEAQLASIDERLHPSAPSIAEAGNRPPREKPHGATWVTRRGLHVDRMASAWLIRRFIDGDARFKFVAGKGYPPASGELRFDMFEAEFTHQGDRCTFEVLLEEFALEEPALRQIAEIVHDIDLKDSKFDRDEVSGLDPLIAGIAMANPTDEARLAQGSAVFNSLYEYFKRRRA